MLSVIQPEAECERTERRRSYSSSDLPALEVAEMIAADRHASGFQPSAIIAELFDLKESGLQDPPNVRLAVHRTTGMVRRLVSFRKPLGVDRQDHLRASVESLQALRCDSVARVLEVFEDGHSISLVTEHCTGGTVYDRILQRQYFAEQETAVLIQHILQAVAAFHRGGLSHGHLAPDSFRFQSEQAHALLKLVDFGLDLKVQLWDSPPATRPSALARRTTCLQLLETCRLVFCAPEVVRPLQARFGRRTSARPDGGACSELPQDFGCDGTLQQADAWSVGAITFLLLCGYPPFFAPYRHAILLRIDKTDFAFDPPFWSKISEEAKDFVQQLLRSAPERRLTVAEALHHPWVRSLADSSPSGAMLSSFALNLRRFYRTSLIEAFTANSLAAKLSYQETQELYRRCCDTDCHRSGFLTATDLRQILSGLGHTEVAEAIGMCFSRALRHPGESYIDYVALVESVRARRERLLEEDLWRWFCSFDPVHARGGRLQLARVQSFIQAPDVQLALAHDGVEDGSAFAERVRQAVEGCPARCADERDGAPPDPGEVDFVAVAAEVIGGLPPMPPLAASIWQPGAQAGEEPRQPPRPPRTDQPVEHHG